MRAGSFDHRITILRQLPAADGSTGEGIGPWRPLRVADAAFLPVTGREGFGADARFTEATARFTMRFDPDVTTTDRVDFEGAVYRILYVQEIPRRRGLVLFCAGRSE